jgi:hypothetical protein
VDGPRPGAHAAGDLRSLRDEALLPGVHAELFAVERQHVRALDDQKPLIEFVDVLGGDGVVLDRPEGHLAAFGAVEHVALDARSVLRDGRDPVRGLLHERREVGHRSHSVTTDRHP